MINLKKYKSGQKSQKESALYNLDEASKNRPKKASFGDRLKNIGKRFQEVIKKKKEERLTLMFIPHNEEKIKNVQISNLNLSVIVWSFTAVVVVSAVMIINHNSTIQEVDKLKISQKDAKIQFSKIREEIKGMEGTFSKIRSKLSQLHALSLGQAGEESNLYGQGGPSIPMGAIENELEPVEKDSIENIPPEIFMLNRIANDLEISREPVKNIEKFLEKRGKIIQNTPTLWPVQGAIINPYGFIRNANTLQTYFNSGIDISGVTGSEVIATAPGIITEVKRESKWLWSVRIRHNYGYETVYKGLDRVLVAVDEKIVKSEAIGYLGRHPDKNESILHYQIFVGVDPQDPLPYLSYLPDTH